MDSYVLPILLKGTSEGIVPIQREQRKRKPNRRYSSSVSEDGESSEDQSKTGTTRDIRAKKHRLEKLEQKAQQLGNDNDVSQDDQSVEALGRQIRKQNELAQKRALEKSTAQQIRADRLLNSDSETKCFTGFEPDDIKVDLEAQQVDRASIVKLEESCADESDSDELLLPENFYATHDFIYLDGLNKKKHPGEWRTAKKIVVLLKKAFGGNPKVVHPLPRWLALKVGYMCL